jgi:ABC-2 type transport system permease protein
MPIFDQGYQHWSGELSGHGWRWLAVTRHGVRAGMKNRLLRYVLFAAWTPAVALAGILRVWGLLERGNSSIVSFASFLHRSMLADPAQFRVDIWRLAFGYFLQVELFTSMVLILLVGPDLISQDLRFNAMPLYFSRPLRRLDYFLGKLGVIVAFLGMVVIAPSVVAYILGLFFSSSLSVFRDTIGILVNSILYGLIISVSAGMTALALSALSRNSRYVALSWVGIWFVTGIIAVKLQAIDIQERQNFYYKQITISAPTRDRSESWDEFNRRNRAWRRARNQADINAALAELNFSKTDWRPLISYEANLRRIGQTLLHTNETWQKLSLLLPEGTRRDGLLAQFEGSQHPWYWSAGVLIGLFGLSACVLNFSVKSMDKLK